MRSVLLGTSRAMDLRRALFVSVVAGSAYKLGQRATSPAPAALPAGGSSGGRGRGGGGPRAGNPRGEGFTAPTPEDPQGSPVGDAPGKDAEKPTDIPAQGWKQILKRAWKEAKEDNVPMLAAGLAYSAFLALFPALIAAVTLYGLFADPAQVEAQVTSLTDALPDDAASLIGGQLRELASTSDSALGVGLVVSIAAALFSASGGVGNLIKAVNVCYDEQESRGFLKLRGTALLLTLGAVVFVLVAIGLVAVLPAVLGTLGLGTFAGVLVQIGRVAGLIVFVVAALAVVYRYAPDRDNPKVKWVALGSIVATVLWVAGSLAFSFYVSNFGSYSKTYGALAGVVILLLWLFLTAYIILLGAEINSETEAQTAKDTTEGPEQPMGERDAVKADELAA